MCFWPLHCPFPSSPPIYLTLASLHCILPPSKHSLSPRPVSPPWPISSSYTSPPLLCLSGIPFLSPSPAPLSWHLYVGFLREAESHSWDACYIWSTFQPVCREARCGAPHRWHCRDRPGAERDTAMPQPKIILTQLWLSLAAARRLANQISTGKAPTLATDASPLS